MQLKQIQLISGMEVIGKVSNIPVDAISGVGYNENYTLDDARMIQYMPYEGGVNIRFIPFSPTMDHGLPITVHHSAVLRAAEPNPEMEKAYRQATSGIILDSGGFGR